LFTILMFLLMFPVYAQESYSVTLTGEPSDCILSIAGAGRYPAGAQVRIEARPTTNCRFMGWVISKGMPFNYTSANPFFFYIDGDFEAKAVFERLYTGPGGEVIERAVVNPVLNISLPKELRPGPLVARVGETISYVFPPEIILGENKYIYLYAEALGNIYSQPEITIKLPPGSVNLTAYYYTYVKFLDEYYPLDQFTTINAEPVRVSDNERKIPQSYTVADKTFPMDKPIPKQLLSLAKVNYATEYRLTVIAEGAEAPVTINGQEILVKGAYQTWVAAGSTLTLTCRTKLDRHFLKTSDSYGLPVSGNCLGAGPVTGPIVVLLTYRQIPNAEFLDTPMIGGLAYSLAELGRQVTGLEGAPSLIMGLAIAVTPPAAVGLGVAAARKAPIVTRAGKRGRGSELQALLLLASAGQHKEDTEDSLRVSGRIIIPPELRKMVENTGQHIEEERRLEEPEEEKRLEEEAEKLVEEILAGGKASIQPYHLSLVYWDEERFEKFKEAVEEKRAKIGGDAGFMGFDSYGNRLVAALDESLGIIVKSPDIGLGVTLALEACRQARKRAQIVSPPYTTSSKQLLEQVKKAGADALIFIQPDPEAEKAIIQATMQTRKTHIIVSDSPYLKPMVELPELGDEDYIPVAIALAAREKVLQYMTLRDIEYMAKMSALDGYNTLVKATAYLRSLAEKEELDDAAKALRQLFIIEVQNTFTSAEMELITQIQSIEQLKTAYIALMRQVNPGEDPVKNWSRLYNRLKRLGMVVEEE